MADDSETGAVRQSSPRFPFIALPKAIQRAEQLRDAAGANYVTPEQVREIWGYAAKSSGGDQTMAALGYYGLLEETGSGATRRVKLSDVAIRYLREERPEVLIEMAAKMVQAPKAMQVLWELWGQEPPNNPGVARSILKNDLGFSDSAAGQVLDVYRTNLQYFPAPTSDKTPENKTSFQEPARDESPKVDPPKVRIGDWVQWTSAGVDQFSTPRKVTWVSGDGFLRVEGSMTGLPVSETTVVEPPGGSATKITKMNADGYSVLLTGDRLQITAEVDLNGLRMLQKMLAKYEEILELMSPSPHD